MHVLCGNQGRLATTNVRSRQWSSGRLSDHEYTASAQARPIYAFEKPRTSACKMSVDTASHNAQILRYPGAMQCREAMQCQGSLMCTAVKMLSSPEQPDQSQGRRRYFSLGLVNALQEESYPTYHQHMHEI